LAKQLAPPRLWGGRGVEPPEGQEMNGRFVVFSVVSDAQGGWWLGRAEGLPSPRGSGRVVGSGRGLGGRGRLLWGF